MGCGGRHGCWLQVNVGESAAAHVGTPENGREKTWLTHVTESREHGRVYAHLSAICKPDESKVLLVILTGLDDA